MSLGVLSFAVGAHRPVLLTYVNDFLQATLAATFLLRGVADLIQ